MQTYTRQKIKRLCDTKTKSPPLLKSPLQKSTPKKCGRLVQEHFCECSRFCGCKVSLHHHMLHQPPAIQHPGADIWSAYSAACVCVCVPELVCGIGAVLALREWRMKGSRSWGPIRAERRWTIWRSSHTQTALCWQATTWREPHTVHPHFIVEKP